MARYRIDFTRLEHSTYINCMTIEFPAPRFTRKHFKILLDNLFMFASTNCDYKYMKVRVTKDSIPVMYAKAVTVVDGCNIDTYIRIGKDPVSLKPYRVMNVAS